MLGIIVQLLLSWLIIWLFEKGNLSFLGWKPSTERLGDFLLLFLITALCCSTGFLFRIYWGKEVWILNPQLHLKLVAEGIWWNLKSVLFEELIFRGVLFYILIRKLGAFKAILISSIAFGIYHWFSQELLGNPVQMLITFVLTGIMGMIFAYGYAKTFSLYIPIAIHLGWNLTQGFVFSSGSIGKGIFIQAAEQTQVTVSYTVYFIIIFFPILSAWVLNFLLLRRKKQAISPISSSHT